MKLKDNKIFNNKKIKNMKNFLLTSILCLGFINATSQCTPNPIYQDSTYNIWPDTVTNMPIYNTSVINSNNPYNGELLIKTPTTIIEASGGDSWTNLLCGRLGV